MFIPRSDGPQDGIETTIRRMKPAGKRPARRQIGIAIEAALAMGMVLVSVSAHAASPSPGPIQAVDPRSGPAAVMIGDPLLALAAVVSLGAATVGATVIYVRLAGWKSRDRAL